MDYYQLIHHGNDNSTWYKLCNCCPYGYHIDLDFVHFCNTLEHVDHTASMKRRKDRRRQRRSMVVLLGLENLSTNQNSSKEEHVLPQPLDLVQESLPVNKSYAINDDLHDAVLDFEQTLQNSKMSDGHSNISVIHENLQYPFSVPHSLKTPVSPSISKFNGSMEHDTNSQPCGKPADLQSIREQMALSLERTKIVEDLVKHIPLLQAQLAELKEEKRQLLLQIMANKEESRFMNGHLLSHSPLQRTMTPHRRDFGVTCSLLTPSDNSKPHTLETSDSKVGAYADKWYKEKSNFLYDNVVNNITYNSSMVTNKKSDTIIVTKETQTTLPRAKKDTSIQTLNITEERSMNGGIEDSKKLFRSVGMSASVHTTESSTEPIGVSVSTVGVSEDTLDAVLCIKCACRNVSDKGTTTFHNYLNLGFQNRTIGCQCDVARRHVLIQCEINTLSDDIKDGPEKIVVSVSTNTDKSPWQGEETHSVSCQYECFSLHKASQIDLKVKDKAIQYDTPFDIIANETCSKCSANRSKLTTSIDTNLNKQFSNISLSSLTVSRSKSFCTFDTSTHRTVSCQYEPFNVPKAIQALPEVEHKATQCENISYFTKFKTKLAPKGASYEKQTSLEAFSFKEGESTLQEHEDRIPPPSKIPRLQITPEFRKLRRQDTYSVDLSKTGSLVADLHISHNNQTELVVATAGTNDELSSPINSSAGPSSYSEAHVDTDIERKKAVPSKGMKAALKVLSDCLSKGQTENLEDQLKNSINIVQLEWFKISSLIKANPLDVEDYLDFFEEVSFNLLQYIVNMVDANGNTAMHYAVSHGNFDVVSILLDSKVCDVNQANKVGYTSVMLVSLVEIFSMEHANVVRRLFKLADVNIKAKQHGQTALMLAVSHGRLDMVQMLLEAGADINIKDDDGSTALMCAAEHGHIEIVKLFLGQPECDSTITDVDGSTALTIAMEAGHRPIGVLLYTHQRIRKSSIQRSKSS